MLRVLLVRHAQSEWNATGRWQGQADPPLSELGRQQAVAAAAALGTVDGIVASTLDRAHHTAAIIAETIGVGPVLVNEQLIERDAGAWSGLTRAEIEAGWPGYLASGRRPPDYEPDEHLLARARRGLDEVAATFAAGAHVLVVAHAGLLYVLEAHHGFPFERVPNMGGRWFEHDGARWSAGERVSLLAPESATVQAPEQL